MKICVHVILAICLLISCAARQGSGLGRIKGGESPDKTIFSGGNGESLENAVIITGATKQNQLLAAEYQYITDTHGEKNKMWSIQGQTIVKEKAKTYDVIEIKLSTPENQIRIFYFDVSTFPWKKY